MIILLFTLLIILGFILTDAIPMFLNKEWKQFWVYVVMMLGILILVFFKQIMNVTLPSPANPMKEAIIAIFGKQ